MEWVKTIWRYYYWHNRYRDILRLLNGSLADRKAFAEKWCEDGVDEIERKLRVLRDGGRRVSKAKDAASAIEKGARLDQLCRGCSKQYTQGQFDAPRPKRRKRV